MTLTKRVFLYENRTLNDPDSNLSPEEVRDIYAATYPELATAVIDGPEAGEGGEQEYAFRRAAGTKG
ncbi:MAG: PRTRC system protein C [Betaproteobacteria bacterium]